MNYFFQCTAAVLVATIVCIVLDRQGKDFAMLITIGVSAMVLVVGISFLEPVISFITDVASLGKLDNDLIQILYKAVGIGILAQIVSLICTDAGNSSIGKAISMLASSVILWLSIPAFQALLELIRNILEQV